MREAPRSPDFEVAQGREGEYRRAKAILNAGKHPTFIGLETYHSSARNGGVSYFLIDGKDAAVAIVSPRTNCLLVLNVLPAYRRMGLGAAIIAYLQVSFARVLEDAVPFFERNGFVSIGAMKQGKKYKTQIMVASGLRELAGRVSRFYSV